MDSASSQSFVSIGHDDISLSMRSMQAAIRNYIKKTPLEFITRATTGFQSALT
jgi:hypothetical protein